MEEHTLISNKFINLAGLLQSPLIELQASGPFKAKMKAKNKLERIGHCSIVCCTYHKHNNLLEIILLRRKIKFLKNLAKSLCQDDSRVTTAIMGIYPSIDQPICVYELGTNADYYITKNILPTDQQWTRRAAKYLIGQFTGIHPATEGVALILCRK